MTSAIGCKVSTKAKRSPGVAIRSNFSADQLRAEAGRSHPSKANKLLALADIVDGESYAVVARQNDVALSSVYYWIHCVNRRGIKAFEQRAHSGRPCRLHKGNETLAEDLADQAETASPKDAIKLLAISKVLLKIPCTEIARDAQVSPSTLSTWIKKFTEGGITGLLGLQENGAKQDGRRVKLRSDVALEDIRAIAAHAERRSARRFEAIALLMEGSTVVEAAQKLNISKSSMVKWCSSFNRQGLDGLIDKWDRKKNLAHQNSAACLRSST